MREILRGVFSTTSPGANTDTPYPASANDCKQHNANLGPAALIIKRKTPHVRNAWFPVSFTFLSSLNLLSHSSGQDGCKHLSLFTSQGVWVGGGEGFKEIFLLWRPTHLLWFYFLFCSWSKMDSVFTFLPLHSEIIEVVKDVCKSCGVSIEVAANPWLCILTTSVTLSSRMRSMVVLRANVSALH